jgi:hypothetical protein
MRRLNNPVLCPRNYGLAGKALQSLALPRDRPLVAFWRRVFGFKLVSVRIENEGGIVVWSVL